jgi:signal transduction histidine kinase
LWPGKHLEIEGDAALRCDGKWLGEAFQNLMKNACEHTAADGCIWVKIEQTEHTVYCSVEDNGGGVREKDLPHLFERFYRSEDQAQSGSGLGLAIVKEIVYRHHGHVSAENGKNGLRINLEIPILNLTKT